MNTLQYKKDEQKNKWIGLAATLVMHTLIFIFLLWSVLHVPDPPLEGGGMELSMALGEPDMGGPSEEAVADPTAAQPAQEAANEEQPTLTQDAEEIDVTAKPVEKKTKQPIVTKPIEKPVVKPIEKPIEAPRVADARAMFKKSSSSTGQGGHGDGIIPGNEGRPDGVDGGSPDGNGIGNGLGGSGGGTGTGIGSGSGDGMGFDLKGRSLARRPDITDNSKETGKVVVGITVDRTGHVIKVQPGLKGSTTLNPTLVEKAKQGAMQARFSPKPDGPEEQYGTMTFIFRFKQ
jgi:outer membrane biosynthesis protein TonB